MSRGTRATPRSSVDPVLVTDHHDEETERLTGLGARPLHEIKLPPSALPPGVAAVRQTTFADPEGNEFDLVTWQPASLPSPGTNRGPIDDLGSAATAGGGPDPRSSKLAGRSSHE